jgi:hypothetical protein
MLVRGDKRVASLVSVWANLPDKGVGVTVWRVITRHNLMSFFTYTLGLIGTMREQKLCGKEKAASD